MKQYLVDVMVLVEDERLIVAESEEEARRKALLDPSVYETRAILELDEHGDEAV